MSADKRPPFASPPVRTVVRADGETAPIELRLTTLDDVPPALDVVLERLAKQGCSSKEAFAIRLSLHEALTNGLRHGNGLDPALSVRLRVALTTGEFRAEVEDEGPGFDPDQVADPTGDEHLAQCGGRGVFLMRHYMTAVRYNERGNRVVLVRRRDERAAS